MRETTLEERALFVRLRAEGKRSRDIAQLVGKPYSTVEYILKKHSGIKSVLVNQGK